MAASQKDLEGWQVITTDEHGNITTNSRRRSRKNNSVEKTYIQRIADGLSFTCGDSVVMHDVVTGVFSVYMIHEIRQNTLNNLIEIWAFSYLRSFELKPQKYYSQFNPEMLQKGLDKDQLRQALFDEIDPYELYLTAELSEIWLKDFKYIAHVYTKEEYDEAPRDRSVVDPADFYVRFICEPSAESFVKMNINKVVRKIKLEEPKSSEEHLKQMTVNMIRPASNRGSSSQKREGHQLKESRVEPDTDDSPPRRKRISRTTSPRSNETSQPTQQKRKQTLFYEESEPESPTNTPISVDSDTSDGHEKAISQTDSDIESSYSVAETDSSPDQDDNLDNEDEEDDTDEEIIDAKLERSRLKRRALRRELFGTERKERKISRSKEPQSIANSSDEDIPLSQIKSVVVKPVPKPSKLQNETLPGPEETSTKTTSATQAPDQTSEEFMLLKRKYLKLKSEYNADNSKEIIESILSSDAKGKDNSKQLDIPALESQIRTNVPNSKKIRTIFSKLKTQKDIDDDKSIIQVIQDFIALPARSKEFARCYLEIFDSLRKNESKAIYINGSSGSGKTCIVKKLLTEVEKSSNYKELSLFKTVILNRETQGDDLYQYLWSSLSGDKDTMTSSSVAERSLEYFFTSIDKNRKRHTVIVLDDLDILCKECPDLLYNFFHWTTYPDSKLVVISMGQNPDLIKETLDKKILGKINYYSIPFENYSNEEVMNIVQYRLRTLKNYYNFEVYQVRDTHQLVVERIQDGDRTTGDDIQHKTVKVYMSDQTIDDASKQICMATNDARTALSVIDAATNDVMNKYASVQNIIMKRNKGFTVANLPDSQAVDLKTILQSLSEEHQTVNVDKIHKLPHIEKLFLFSCLVLVRSNKTLILKTEDIFEKMAHLINNNKTKRFIRSVLQVLMAHNDTINVREELHSDAFKVMNWNNIITSLISSQLLEIVGQNDSNNSKHIRSIKMKVPLLDLSDALNVSLID